MVALDVTTVSHMAPGRFFRDHTSAVNALDFHHTEDALVTTGDDDAIHLYNTNTGAKTRTLYSKKYCLLYTSPSPRDRQKSRMPSSA